MAPILWSLEGARAAVLGTSLRDRTISQLWRIWFTASVRLTASTTPETFSPPAYAPSYL